MLQVWGCWPSCEAAMTVGRTLLDFPLPESFTVVDHTIKNTDAGLLLRKLYFSWHNMETVFIY